MEYWFQVTTSFSAAVELPAELMSNMAQKCIHESLDRDEGQDGGDVYSFDHAGKEWKVVVFIGHRWAKIMSKDDYNRAAAEGMRELSISSLS
jgi:hypothetical protein